MIQDSPLSLTGYGISSRVWDGDHRIITVDPNTMTITAKSGKQFSFSDYAALESPSWDD
jgi:hypothetical protein